MRVWHVTRTLHGGAGRYAHRLSEALRKSGMDSCVLSDDQDGVDEGDQVGTGTLTSISGVFSRFGTRVVRSMSRRMTSAPYQSLMGMEQYGGKKMPSRGDIIHLHSLTSWLGLRGLNALIPDDSPVFWTIHDLWPLSGGCIIYSGCQGYRSNCGSCPILRTGLKSWAKIELKMKEKLIRERKICAIANSGWMASHIEHSPVFGGISDVPVIPPIIDPAYFAPDIEDIRGQLQIAPGKKVIALGARAVTDQYKGIPEFLNALANRRELSEQCVILLFGEGELELPKGLDVRVLGMLNAAGELAQLYCASDVFVSPSSMETFGMALAEAQACGTPVVAFGVGGVSDAVSEECARFLVPEGDMNGLLDALGEVIQKNTREGGRWRVNRDWARERFDGTVMAQRQKEVYCRAVEV